MLKINTNFLELKNAYLFAEVASRRAEFSKNNPSAKVISLGIGDVTRPLAPAIVDALVDASREMGTKQGFRGYAPYQGYDFLVERILQNDLAGLDIAFDEVFVSDGAKSDMGNICDIFAKDNVVAVTNPVYPVYADTNIMSGRKVVYLSATKENGFCPLPEKGLKADIIYLCSPNNPTGTALNREQLGQWVSYALSAGAVILFDAAYEAFITEDDIPRSIYEIEGAKKCAIEFRTFSKTAGFTGVRCGYSVVPKQLVIGGEALHSLWYRRYSTKFNGVAYIIQRAAEAVYSKEGQAQTRADIAYYLNNAHLLKTALEQLGYTCFGGVNSPYVWFDAKANSWDFFDMLLNKAHIVCTPGAGFGSCGEGFVRFTSFGSYEDTLTCVDRLKKLLG